MFAIFLIVKLLHVSIFDIHANSGRVGGADANMGHADVSEFVSLGRVSMGCDVLTVVEGLEVIVGLTEMVGLMVVVGPVMLIDGAVFVFVLLLVMLIAFLLAAATDSRSSSTVIYRIRPII